jgi:hypothetical protein
MKDAIVNWLMKNRAPISYTIGILNVLSGLSNIALGNVVGGVFWIVIGSVIIFDTWTFK